MHSFKSELSSKIFSVHCDKADPILVLNKFCGFSVSKPHNNQYSWAQSLRDRNALCERSFHWLNSKHVSTQGDEESHFYGPLPDQTSRYFKYMRPTLNINLRLFHTNLIKSGDDFHRSTMLIVRSDSQLNCLNICMYVANYV